MAANEPRTAQSTKAPQTNNNMFNKRSSAGPSPNLAGDYSSFLTNSNTGAVINPGGYVQQSRHSSVTVNTHPNVIPHQYQQLASSQLNMGVDFNHYPMANTQPQAQQSKYTPTKTGASLDLFNP